MIIRNLLSKFNDFSQNINDWIFQFDRSPIFYGGLFLVGIVIFYLVYESLHKD